MLVACINPIHGNASNLLNHTLQQLLKNTTLPEKLMIDSLVEFVCKVMKKAEDGEEQIIVFMQHTCLRVCEHKAEVKSLLCEALCQMFKALSDAAQQRFISYLIKFAKNKKGTHRLFALECAMSILDQFLSAEKVETVSKETIQQLLIVLMSRLSDKIVGVRSKALGGFVQALQLATTNDLAKTLVLAVLNQEPAAVENKDEEVLEDAKDSTSMASGAIWDRMTDSSPVCYFFKRAILTCT